MSELFTGATINIDSINSIGESVPFGRYVCQLVSAEGKEVRDTPTVIASFEVLEGDYAGMEVSVFYRISATKGKDGKWYSQGISAMKSAFSAVGKALPKGFDFPMGKDQAALLYARRMKDLKVEIAVMEQTYTDRTTNELKKTTRRQVVGLSGPVIVEHNAHGIDLE
jgi:hypothetical protein